MTSAIASTNSLIAGLANVIGTAVNTKQTNKTNYAIAQMTNANNRQLVAAQNEAARKESELAYQRSKASNQVNLMTSAGMSRAGAINALNGGGSYTPAPVNTSQDQAPQMQTTDLSGLSSMAQIFAQQAMHDKDLREEKRQFDLSLAETKRMNDDALKTSDVSRKLLNLEVNGKTIENEINGILRDIEKELYDDGTTINAERAERVAKQASAFLNDFRDKRVLNVMQGMSDDELRSLFEIQGIMNTLSRVTNYDAPRVINDVYKYAKKVLSKYL